MRRRAKAKAGIPASRGREMNLTWKDREWLYAIAIDAANACPAGSDAQHNWDRIAVKLRGRPPKPESAAAVLGRKGGSANTAAQLAQRRAAAQNAGRPREPKPCRHCGKETTERDGRYPDCGAHD